MGLPSLIFSFFFFTGKVVGEENQKLIGAFVYIEELGIGDDTDATGSFLSGEGVS